MDGNLATINSMTEISHQRGWKTYKIHDSMTSLYGDNDVVRSDVRKPWTSSAMSQHKISDDLKAWAEISRQQIRRWWSYASDFQKHIRSRVNNESAWAHWFGLEACRRKVMDDLDWCWQFFCSNQPQCIKSNQVSFSLYIWHHMIGWWP